MANSHTTKINIPTAKGAQRGENTHNHDHEATTPIPANFKTRNTIKTSPVINPVKFIFIF